MGILTIRSSARPGLIDLPTHPAENSRTTSSRYSGRMGSKIQERKDVLKCFLEPESAKNRGRDQTLPRECSCEGILIFVLDTGMVRFVTQIFSLEQYFGYPDHISMETTKPAISSTLDAAVQFVKGIGPRRAEMLAAHGIRSVRDLVEYLPFRYEDRTRFRPIRSLKDGEWVLVRGEVCGVGTSARAAGLLDPRTAVGTQTEPFG